MIVLLFFCWHRLGILRFKGALGAVALGELCVLSIVAVPRAPSDDASARLASAIPDDNGRAVRFGARIPVQSARLAGRHGIEILDSDGAAILDRTAHLLEMVQPGIVRGQPDARVAPLATIGNVENPLLARAGVSAVISEGPLVSARYSPLLAAPGGGEAGGPSVNVAVSTTPRARLAFRARPAGDESAAAREMLAHPDEPSTPSSSSTHPPTSSRAARRRRRRSSG